MNRTLKKLLIRGGVRLTGGGLPFQDTFTRADGALGGSWLGGSTWQIASGKAVNTPTAGEERLTDGGMETWTSATNLTSWTETLAGTSTVNREATVIHGGTYSARIDIDAVPSAVSLAQGSITTVGQWYQLTAWLKSNPTGKILFFPSTQPFASGVKTLSDTYAQYLSIGRATNTGMILSTYQAASSSFYVDDVSAKLLTLATLFNAIQSGSANVTVSAAATIVAGTQAGVFCNLDSVASPANFVIGYHDGVSAKLEKCVNGTYTTLVTATVAYSAGAAVMVKRLAGTDTMQLWYNGVQIGADQTVSDAGIISNTLHGLLSTYSGNTLDTFTVSAT
jgi:hypothetical protein